MKKQKERKIHRRERGTERAVIEGGKRGEGESQSEQKGRLVLGLRGHFNATLHSVKILLTL